MKKFEIIILAFIVVAQDTQARWNSGDLSSDENESAENLYANLDQVISVAERGWDTKQAFARRDKDPHANNGRRTHGHHKNEDLSNDNDESEALEDLATNPDDAAVIPERGWDTKRVFARRFNKEPSVNKAHGRRNSKDSSSDGDKNDLSEELNLNLDAISSVAARGWDTKQAFDRYEKQSHGNKAQRTHGRWNSKGSSSDDEEEESLEDLETNLDAVSSVAASSWDAKRTFARRYEDDPPIVEIPMEDKECVTEPKSLYLWHHKDRRRFKREDLQYNLYMIIDPYDCDCFNLSNPGQVDECEAKNLHALSRIVFRSAEDYRLNTSYSDEIIKGYNSTKAAMRRRAFSPKDLGNAPEAYRRRIPEKRSENWELLRVYGKYKATFTLSTLIEWWDMRSIICCTAVKKP